MRFEKAVRKKAKLRLAIIGPSGSGKTLGALMVAKGIGGRIALIDTEKGSASLYAAPVRLADGRVWQPPAFDVLELGAPYSPERYTEAVLAAQGAGYDTLIIDSTTHEWSGVGGCLELVDEVARARFKGNSWSAWNEVTPRHRAFIDAMLQAPMHVIATGRSKTETAQTEGNNGKKQVVKLGMKVEQRDGFEYEFTTVLDLVHNGHFALASKDRTGLFVGDPKPISEDTGHNLLAWLDGGADASEALLAELRDAAANGTDVLIAAYNRLKPQPGFAALWKSEGAALKAAAARNDGDPADNADATPPAEPANVDAAGTYLGEPA